MSKDDDNDFILNLTDREKRILKEKIGLENLDRSSLEQVGKQFEVTRAKIREIEERALKKLNCDNDPNDDDPEAA